MENNQPKSNKGLIAVMVLIIVLILILSCGVGYLLFGEQLGLPKLFAPQETTAPTTEEVTTAVVTTDEPTTAEPEWEVPDTVGMKAHDAYTALNHAGTRFQIKREYSKEVDAEYVISQEPEPGTMIKDSEKVLVIISKGVDQPNTKPRPTQSTTGATAPTKKQSSGTSGDYILDGSDKRYVSFSEVTPLSEWQMTIALNEIYARRGRKFSTPELQEYFNSKSWYKGTISPSDFNEGSLNKYEAANVQTILAVMTERGYR